MLTILYTSGQNSSERPEQRSNRRIKRAIRVGIGQNVEIFSIKTIGTAKLFTREEEIELI